MKLLALFATVMLALVCSAPVGAVTAGIALDVHQDIQTSQQQMPNDFHVEGKICSYVSAPVLTSHIDGCFAPPAGSFTYSITKSSPDPNDRWYNFKADWASIAGIPYCTQCHFALVFDVEGVSNTVNTQGTNTIVKLVGWWTLGGQQIGTGTTGALVNKGNIPVTGFDVEDSAGAPTQSIRITNDGVDSSGNPISIANLQITKMDVIAFPANSPPSIDDLTDSGGQVSWIWVPVNNVNGYAISDTNPVQLPAESSFDVMLLTRRPAI